MLEQDTHILKQSKLKVTPIRKQLLRLLSADCNPMNVESIAKAIQADMVTIYRTLASFEKAGIVKKIDLRKGAQFYELSGHHHHHIICTNCGKVEEFDDCAIPSLSKKILKQSKQFKTISEHSLELFGCCIACANI